MLLFTRIGASGSAIVYVMIPGLLTAAGIAMSIVPSTIAATQGAKEGQAGLASGLVNTSRQVGGGLGLAVLITLATQRTQPSDRRGPAGAAGADRRLPARLPDRRRPGRGGGAGHVHARCPSPPPREARRRTAPGARDRRRRSRASSRSTVAFAGSHGAPIGAYTTDGTYSFVTAPSLHPPKIRSTTRRAGRASWRPATSSPPTSTT